MQQHKKIQKYLLDIDSIIEELDNIIDHHQRNFNDFQQSFISVRAVERDLMIIGEAINKIIQINPEIDISGTRQIIGLRNLIVHAYDSIEPLSSLAYFSQGHSCFKERNRGTKKVNVLEHCIKAHTDQNK